MAENSAIEWTDHTWSPWQGCQKTGSPACEHCYAEARDQRFSGGVHWGPHAERRIRADSGWKLPLRWDREGAAAGVQRRVFPSLCDPFDNKAPAGARRRFADLILATPNLTWLLLTKRIGNAAEMLAEMFSDGTPANVWLGATVVTQDEADRDIPKLLATPAAKRFLFMEPLLAPVTLDYFPVFGPDRKRLLHWIIVGGESGPSARPMHPDWARSLRDQCATAGVPFLFKQWGEYGPYDGEGGVAGDWLDPNGHYYGGPTQWPSAEDERRAYMIRWGKKAAGRLLDGVEHNAVPA